MQDSILKSDFLLWKNPLVTGGTLAVIDIVIICYGMDYSFIALLSKLGLLLVVIGFVVKVLKLVDTNAGDENGVLPKEAVENFVGMVSSTVNSQLTFAKDVVLWKDQNTTVKALGVLYLVSVLPDVFNLTFLAFLLTNLLFAVPKLYSQQKELVDKSVAPHLKKAQEVVTELWGKIPRVSDVKKID